MATSGPTDSAASETRSAPQDITALNRMQEELPSSTPQEMSSLASKPGAEPIAAVSEHKTTPPPAPSISTHQALSPVSAGPSSPSKLLSTTTILPSPASPISPQVGPSFTALPVTRTYSTAIGPSTEQNLLGAPESAGPTLLITLLLTNGARHPFKLDGKYLTKRNVDVPGNDPFYLSVYKLKELILREWREEWEAKPSSPSFIRLISFGKLLDDKAPLKDSRFNHDAPNVVHMTIKPQDYIEEEDAKGGKAGYSGSRDGNERSPGCRCVIM